MIHRVIVMMTCLLATFAVAGCGPACPRPVGATEAGVCPPGESAYHLPDSPCPVCVTIRYRDFAFCMDRVGRKTEALRKVQEAKGKLGASYGVAASSVEAEKRATEELRTEYGSTEAGVNACVNEFMRAGALARPSGPTQTTAGESAPSLLEAMKRNTYDFGWSNSPFGTPDRGSQSYAVVDVHVAGENVVTFRCTRPGGNEFRATISGRKLTGVWRDVEGTGEFELTFDQGFARAEGWWNFGGQAQKYNAYMRRRY